MPLPWRTTLTRVLLSHHLLALCAYLVLSWLTLFGLRLDVTEHSFAGGLDHDAGTYVWYLWHLKEALFGGGELLFSDRMFYPMGMNMVRQDWTPTTSALGLPFAWAGPVGAYNLEVLLAMLLCGYFTYLLGLRLCGNKLYAFLAGLIFAFCEFRILKACYHGHLTHINQQFIPLYLYFWVSYFARPRWYYAAGAGASFFFATFATPYQMVFLLVFSVLYMSYRLLRAPVLGLRPLRLSSAPLWATLKLGLAFTALSAGTAVLLVLPLFIAMPWEAMSLGASSLSGFSPEFSADLLSYVWPTQGKEMGWPNFSGEGGCAFQGYTVWALFLLSVYALIRYRSGTGQWLAMAGCCFVLSLGSVLVFGGKQLGALPFFALLEQIPIIRGARVASRFSIGVTLSIACMACVTLALLDRRWLTNWPRWRRWLVRGAVVGLVAFELLSYRYWLLMVHELDPEVFPVPQVYQKLAKQRRDSSILVYPLTWEIASDHIGPLHFPRGHYYNITLHRKRLITGFGDAVPAHTLAYFRRIPLLRELVAIEAGLKVPLPAARQQQAARYVADFLEIDTVVVNRRKVAKDQRDAGPRATRAAQYLDRALGYAQVPDLPGLTVLRRPAARARAMPPVEFSAAASFVHLGHAWSRTVQRGQWMAQTYPSGRETEILLVRLPPGRAATLHATLRCVNMPASKLRVRLNGHDLGQIPCPGRWQEVQIKVPAAAALAGVNRLFLTLATATQQDTTRVPVGSTGTLSAKRIQVTSQGLAAGNAASIICGGVDLAPNARGYNVSVIDPRTGHNLSSVAFDLVTDRSGEQAIRLARFIKAVPAGMIVAVAVKDDGSINCRPEVLEALRSVGVVINDPPPLRASFAVVGVKGAQQGTALQGASADSAVTLEVGRLLQLRRLALTRNRRP